MLALILGGFLLAGCNVTDSQELTNDAGKLAETATRSVANASLAVKVNTHLSLRKGVDMSGLRIESEGGTVTVLGHVHTPKEKSLILTLARETRGVERVVDKLRVDPKP